MSGGNGPGRSDGDKLRELGYLAAAVSHHVINAYHAIVSNAEMVRSREGDPADAAELELMGTAIVNTSIEASQVARRLIDWAQRASSIEYDHTGSKTPLCDLNQVIREKVEAEQSVEPSAINWTLTLGSIPPIPGDARGLGAMLGYLLQNAREALPQGEGTIEVSTYIDPRSWLVIAIRDTGCGMSPDILTRDRAVFQHQARARRRRTDDRSGNLAP